MPSTDGQISRLTEARQECPSFSSWRQLAPRFLAGRDCLAAFLALEAAEVLAGAKPANLVRLPNQPQPCGRSLYQLWQLHHDEILRQSPVDVVVLREESDHVLLLIMRTDLMTRRLAGRSAGTFLHQAGYREPRHWPSILDQLRQRFQVGFPHEIGFFLGYPRKDVAAFMGLQQLPVSRRRLWTIYGHARRSLRLADHYRQLRQRMSEKLATTQSPLGLLAAPTTATGESE